VRRRTIPLGVLSPAPREGGVVSPTFPLGIVALRYCNPDAPNTGKRPAKPKWESRRQVLTLALSRSRSAAAV
jgi:hypothetical protein